MALSKIQQAAQLAPQATAAITNATSSWSTATKVIVGGGVVAVAGYFIYRHYKKGK